MQEEDLMARMEITTGKYSHTTIQGGAHRLSWLH